MKEEFHSSDWTNENILEFIELYQNHPVIWNPKHSYHKNRKIIWEAWTSIKNQFSLQLSIEALKRKKECLMTTYRTMKKKIIASQTSGGDVYKPCWFAFEPMNSFLADITISTQLNDSSNTINNHTKFEEEKWNNSEDTMCPSLHYESNTSSPKERVIKKRAASSSAFDIQDTGMVQTFKKRVSYIEERDECQQFAELLATKLRKLGEKAQKVLMHNINNLVFEAEMEELDIQCTITTK